MEEKFVYGCLPAKKDIRDYKIKKQVAMAGNYPDKYECPKNVDIKNQGSVGSCVAHATAEILEYHEGKKMSTNFIYGIHHKLYNSKGPGMYLREACNIVKDYGDPEQYLCPGNVEVDSVYAIAEKAFTDESVMKNAALHRINSYARLTSEDRIKYSLMNYGPVLCAINWYDNNKLDPTTNVMIKGSGSYGGHAMMITGWNETGWILQNSWGFWYGDHGKFILPYDYKLTEAYAFVPEENKSDVVVPPKNSLMKIIYAVINSIINIFVRG